MKRKYNKDLEQAVAEYNEAQGDESDHLSCVDIASQLIEAADDKVERVIAALKSKSKDVIEKFTNE